MAETPLPPDDTVYRVIFESSNDPQYVLDFQSERFLEVNDAFIEFTGYTRQEALAPTFHATQLIARESLPTYSVKRESRILRTRDRYELKMMKKDGTVRPVEVSVHRISIGGRWLIIGGLKDLSETKQRQQELWGRIEELGFANSRIFALTEKLRRVPSFASRLLNVADEQELLERATETLCSREGLAYAQAKFYMLSEGALEAVQAGTTTRSRRIADDGEHRYFRILKGEEPPALTAKEVILPLRGRDANLGILEVKFEPKELETLKGNDRALKGYFDVLETMADLLGLLIENLRLAEAVRLQAITDPLTTVYNRRHFTARLNEEVHRCERYGRGMSLIMLDVDHFKQINDTLGHKQGDLVLSTIGRALRSLTREVDTVCRYGGDEFAVLLPETELDQALKKAEALRKAIGEMEFPISYDGQAPVKTTASLGVASHRRGSSADDLSKRADDGLYAAKRAGRDRVASGDGPETQSKLA